ncbi:MAG: FecR domain-containing protein [Cytophagales bacterium]|nr:FecR domain-containing protein [Cytophagales bacterium]
MELNPGMMKDYVWKLMMLNISGNANSLEQEELRSILSKDDEKAVEYRQLEKIWQSSGMKLETGELGTDREWHRLEVRLAEASAVDQPPVFRMANSWIGVAASLVLLMVWIYILVRDQGTAVEPQLAKVTAVDSVKSFYLPDSSRVWLNINSQLTYLPGFGTDHREMTLYGEAFFEVRRDTTRQFLIAAGGLKVGVLGTTFNVKSYPADSSTEVTVISGKVAVRDSAKVIFLTRDEKAVYSNSEKILSKTRVNQRAHLDWMKSNDAVYHEEVADFLQYLQHDHRWEKNGINLSKVSGSLMNNATLAIYKNIELKATYYTKNKGQRNSTIFTIEGPIRPGERLEYGKTLFFDWLSNTSDIKINIQQVEIEKVNY